MHRGELLCLHFREIALHYWIVREISKPSAQYPFCAVEIALSGLEPREIVCRATRRVIFALRAATEAKIAFS